MNDTTPMKCLKHFLPADITMPRQDQPRILLVGAGGNGTAMVTGLARINHALRKLHHPGIAVAVMDPDIVSPDNVGRQLYSEADVGRNKAECFVTRVNNFFGIGFEAYPCAFDAGTVNRMDENGPSMIITAVDNVEARVTAHRAARKLKAYWLDMGNAKRTGQCILGTGAKVKQPPAMKDQCVGYLPTTIDLYPDLHRHDSDPDQGPSCGLEAALEKQDLFINTAVTTYALSMLWEAFRNGYLTHHGVFLNLDTKRASPMPINPLAWQRAGWKPRTKREKDAARQQDSPAQQKPMGRKAA